MPHRLATSSSASWQFGAPGEADGSGLARPSVRRRRWALEPRFQIVLACFLATTAAYAERVGFSIAWTAMCSQAGVDEGVKGMVLSAFFWGYGASQIPGGWAAQRYGGERVLAWSFAAWSLGSLLTPGTAASPRAMAAVRVGVGLAQGFLIPSVHTVLAAWVPPAERARAVSLTTSGLYLGSAAAMLALPTVVARLGPAALIRLVGGLGLAWLGVWRLTLRRVRRLVAAASMPPPGGARPNGNASPAAKGRPAATPWRALLTCPAVWAIVANSWSFHYALFVVMNWMPTYYDKVLHAELARLSAVKALPYVAMFLASNGGAWAGDWLIGSRQYRVASARKAINLAGFSLGAMSLMLIPGARSVAGGVAVMTLALGCCAFARGGFAVNHMDIAPSYAGVLMGISNTAGTLSGVVGVPATGFLLQFAGGADKTAGWTEAMAAAALQCVASSLVFLSAAQGERLFGGDAAASEELGR